MTSLILVTIWFVCICIVSSMVGGLQIRPVVAWYNLWVGFFWDRQKHRLYFFPVPCFGLVIAIVGDKKQIQDLVALASEETQK